MNLLEVNNVTIGFPNEAEKIIPVIENIQFEIEPFEIVGIVGESGSGKSLTALSILQLHHYIGARAIHGEILFQNKNLMKCSEKELQTIRGKDIAMIFQDPYSSFNPLISIGTHLDETLKTHSSFSYKERRKKILEILANLALPHPEKLIKSYPHELSGGMLQRVMIGTTILCSPKLLIADEITTALDVTTQKIILSLLKDLQKKFNLSILFITHDLSLIANIADRIIIMYAGRIVETGTVQNIFMHPHHPYTQGLLNSLPEKNLKLKNLPFIPGNVPELMNKPKGCPFHPRCIKVREVCKTEFPKRKKLSPSHTSQCVL